MLFDGTGVAVDRSAALAWYRRAAGRGHARAMNLVARCYEEGWGCERNPLQAADWYRRSAEAGYFRAQFNHGCILAEQGRADEAAHWLRLAARADESIRSEIARRPSLAALLEPAV
jgi:TPR repeat protein